MKFPLPSSSLHVIVRAAPGSMSPVAGVLEVSCSMTLGCGQDISNDIKQMVDMKQVAAIQYYLDMW